MIVFGTSQLAFGAGPRCVRCVSNVARRVSQLANGPATPHPSQHSLGLESSHASIVRPARPRIEVAASTERQTSRPQS
jgi:hypothetical protein